MGGASCCPIPWPSGPRVSRETTHNDTAQDEDDLQLLKLGYRAELARAWVAFDNVTFSFAALHCIGGIRVFFYIVLSAGGPAAMIWLPIGVSKTYGFRPAEYGFTSTYNGGAVSSVSTHLAILPKKQSRPGNPPPTESFGRPWPHRYAVSIIILFLFCMPTIETFHDAVNILAGLSGGREYESNHQSFIQIIVVTLAIPIVGLHG
ncbi:hypothetical protein KXX25_002573 [Aspergillus fumigatus]|nr:hypothetical protein KXX25_002573 [Aspergillus fumigatus]KAH2333659.1 hypothetical protein KXW87_009280 [Aspergillus fumigatus]KAH2420079.1 hypothetical protein KXV44_007277 [Aspergillus fumigatus]KAH2464209.1 hypothetical protein KXW63_007086 [Aspergillus fumigatus]KAH2744127.1 hypothetical protein KXW77_005256 [Aspergillus fumigatus]